MSKSLFPILVKVWAGEHRHDLRYISRSLPSLLSSKLPDSARVILVDDCSPNPYIAPFLGRLARQYPIVEVRRNPQRLGPNKGHEYNVPLLWEQFPQAPFIVCCDDDVIYHPGWLQRLIQVYHEARESGLAGVFTALNVPVRSSYGAVSLPTSQVLLKERQMALNWLVPREVYDKVGPFRDVGVAYDTDYCNRMAKLGLPVICLKPSYVQNIGYHGAYQIDDSLTAHDYVGYVPWDLCVRDLWYATRRSVRRPAQICYDCIPEGRLKRFLRRVRGVQTRPVAASKSCYPATLPVQRDTAHNLLSSRPS